MILPTIDIVDRPRGMGYDGYIDNLLIRLAVSDETPMEDVTADATPPRVDTSEAAEDVRDEVGRRYSRSNFSGGAGLDFLHSPQRPDDAATRYWDSRGVDVFGTERGDIYDARLLHRMDAVAGTTAVLDVVQIDGTVYYLTSTTIFEYPSTSRATPSSPAQLVALGNSVYVLDGSGVGRYDPPTWTRQAVSTTVFDKIWPVKSRILGVVDNLLYDATDDSVVLTLPPADTVTSVIEAGPAVLVFSTTGNVYPMTLDQNEVLVPAGESKFINEIPLLGAEAFGVTGIATASKNDNGGTVMRFYTGALTVSGSFDLTDLQLIFTVGDRDTTEDLTPQAMFSTRDSIYVAVPEEGTTATTLWRYYLPTGGYARAEEIPADSNPVRSAIKVNDQIFAAAPGKGLIVESDEYITEGYIVGPLADFYTNDDKQWVGGEVTAAPIPLGAGLELYHTPTPELISQPTSTSWQLVLQLYAGESSREVTNIAGFDSRYHAAKVVLRSDPSRLSSPELRSYSFRGLPAPKREILIRIPINVSDQVERPGRRPIRVRGRGLAMEQALRAYEGEQVIVEIYRPSIQILGLIEKFESTITTIPDRGHPRRVMYARVRGSRVTDNEAITETTSGASLGQDTLGVARIGVGEVNQ